jgi:hypothetical protein
MFGQQAPWNRLIAMLAIYVGTSQAVWLVFSVISGAINAIHLSAFDHQLGLLLGIAKGALVCVVVTFFAVTLAPAYRNQIVASRSGRLVAEIIMRADEILPPNFLTDLVPHLVHNDHCCFVQANHRARPDAESKLARDLGVGIDIHWKWYQPLRNRFGFVMFLGHGAVLRRASWEAVGGFPELARIGTEVRLFEGEVQSVVNRSNAAHEGITFTGSPTIWSPELGVEVLVVTGRTKNLSFVVALYAGAADKYRLASSFLMLGDVAPVALAYNPQRRKELLWSSCWGCSGEQGSISLRDDHRVVIVQH